MKILFNTFILLIIVINICYAQGSFEYYNDLNKYLESLEIDEKDRNYYRKNVFSPERIEKINYSIEEICIIPYDITDDINGIKAHSYSYTIGGPDALFNFLFYIDDEENLYFTDKYSFSPSKKYVSYNREGMFLEKNIFEKLYSLIENTQYSVSNFILSNYLETPNMKWNYFGGNFKLFSNYENNKLYIKVE